MNKTPTWPTLRPDRPGGSAALGATTQNPSAFRESSRRGRRSHTGSCQPRSAAVAQTNVSEGTPARWARHRPDSGFALIIGLLLLVVMSVIGVTMMGVTRLETLMAGGARESSIAFQATEAALRDAEVTIDDSDSLVDFVGEGWFKDENATEPDFFAATTWDPNGNLSAALTDYPELLAVEVQPRYAIKYVGNMPDAAGEKQAIAIGGYAQGGVLPMTFVFRVTARGTSRDGSAETILQSYFGKIY